ncbi:MAG: deoxyribose-phosphate aldolase [Chloroflexi bacterium]|nr:deoxyribose-phosphate aldolase [Chloroflexota bacterium]
MTTPALSLSAYDIAQMIDVSAVRADSTDEKIRELVACAKRYHCFLVTALPSQTENAKALLGGLASPKLGGNVGFPSGGQTTRAKLQETRELLEMGVDEIDMVIDIAAHLSGRRQHVFEEIAAVVEASQGRPVKAILECFYLNDDQVRAACDLAIKAGAAYVKTGTGWTPVGATLDNVALIKAHVGDAIKIKASGGIHDVETLLEMYRRGASRFGISSASTMKILQSIENQA